MKSLCAVLCLAANAASAAVPAPQRALTDPQTLNSVANAAAAAVPVRDLFFSRSNAGAAWSPDGKEVVVSTNFTGRYNLWRVSAAGSWPVQLTQSDDRQAGVAWSPDGKWIVFQSDHAGGEIFDLYAVPAQGGAVINLTDSDDVSEERANWSPDGKTLYFPSARDGHNCLWGQQVEASSRRPVGGAFAVQHLHGRVSYGNGGWLAAGGRIGLSLSETTGNIWMMSRSGAR